MDKTKEEETMKTFRVTNRKGVVMAAVPDLEKLASGERSRVADVYVLSGEDFDECRLGEEIAVTWETGPFTEDAKVVGTVVGMAADCVLENDEPYED